VSGALPGRSYSAQLTEAGFLGAEVVRATGVWTSKFTQAHLIRAVR
jgi:hypothetical protein